MPIAIPSADSAARSRLLSRPTEPTRSTSAACNVLRRNVVACGVAGGHAVVRFNNLRIPASDILGEPGKGFRYAQVRLAPARLTHCMRWLGAARRAHDIATGYALKRDVFGAKLIGHEGAGFMLADNEIDIRMAAIRAHRANRGGASDADPS